ncbi:MAG: hypothetical protein HY690_17705 [Chloroflexi bacterium]|nr:hypothetical protein [Chloroflexota bacterium]
MRQHSNRTWIFVATVMTVALLGLACTQAPTAAPSQQQQPAAAPAPQQPAAPAAPAAGPAAQTAPQARQAFELPRRAGQPPYPIKVLETHDASGSAAYQTKPGDLLVFTNTSRDAKTGKNGVVVMDAKTKKVVASAEIELPGNAGSHNLGVSPDGRWLYMGTGLGNPEATGLYVIDARTLKLAQLLDVGAQIHHFQVYQDKYLVAEPFGRVQLTMRPDAGANGPIFLDPRAENALVNWIPQSVFEGKFYIGAFSPDGRYYYATVRPHQFTYGKQGLPKSWLAKVDLQTGTEVGNAEVGDGAIWPTVSRDGKFGYVTGSEDDRVWKVDLEKMETVGMGRTGPGVYGAVISADGKKLFTADKGEGSAGGRRQTITIFDTETMGSINTIWSALPTNDHVILSPDGKEIWATSNAASTVSGGARIGILDIEKGEMAGYIQMPYGGGPHASVFVYFDQNNQGHVVMDNGGPHGGFSPYAYDNALGIPSLAVNPQAGSDGPAWVAKR